MPRILVDVMLKPEILDPQGQAIVGALPTLSISGVRAVRQGKHFELDVEGDETAALELTYNWDPEPYTGGRNFGHLAYSVDNICDTCNAFIPLSPAP